jgi:Outer membrane receptor for monomeric catechols
MAMSAGSTGIGPSDVDGEHLSNFVHGTRIRPMLRIGTMAISVKRAFHASSAGWLLMCGMGGHAMSQDAASPAATQLPGITVTSPSPIVRRNVVPSRAPVRVARAVPARHRALKPQAQPTRVAAAPQPPAPQQGVLPVVTGQFATVTVVPNEEIRRQGGATLGDLLSSKPGITGSSFAPGASSRPIIRGLDVNRVGIVRKRRGGRRCLRSRRRPFRTD